MKELQAFEFYYTLIHNTSIKYIVETKICKSPEQTKIYKSLKMDLNQMIIHSFGYQIKNK